MNRSPLFLAVLFSVLAGPAHAQPVVDGTRAGDPYGTYAAFQVTETSFGDNENELDAAYCTMARGRLFLMLTGNLNDNFNSLEIFIDSKAGGENVLSGQPGNDFSSNMAGMGFDAGFEPDYYLIARRGNQAGNRFDLDFAELGTANFSSYGNLFAGNLEGTGATGVGLNLQPIAVSYDNSNVAGVVGGSGPANALAALAVETGLELSIALSDLGFVGGEIRACAFINNNDHNFASNQFLGPVPPPQGSMGADGNGTFTGIISFNLAAFAGDQFFSCGEQAVPATQSSWGRVKSSYR
jgi:hypothetical protein